MKILIIEDELPNYMRLKKLLAEIEGPAHIIEGPLISQTEVKDYFSAGTIPDLIISDIRLSDGLVFDAFDNVRCRTRIIFTTAYSEYAVKAFKYNSIHYLLKPIVKKELAEALAKASLYNPEPLSEIKNLTDGLAHGTPRKRFLVPWRDGFEIIKTDDVAFLKYDNGTLRIYRYDGRNYPVEMTIDECEQQLGTEMFFRANRQFIININSISKLVNYWDRKMRIVLNDFPEIEVMVSRDKSKSLRKWLDR